MTAPKNASARHLKAASDGPKPRAKPGKAAPAAPAPAAPPPAPQASTRVRTPLRTVDDVRAELGRIYRDAKGGKRKVADVSRMANVLAIMGRLIEGGEFEARLAAMEAAAKKQGED